MKPNSPLKAALACLLTLTLIGCTAGSQRQQIDAGVRVGIAAAKITLEPQPAECASDTPHASLTAGQEAAIALRRERAQLDAANASKRRCYDFNANQAEGLANR